MVDAEDVGRQDVVVMDGAGAGAGVLEISWEEVGVVVVGSGFSSLQPNQPGVLHVDVDFDLLEVDVVVVGPVVVVDSSKHPNHPGVLHVSVLVLLVALVLEMIVEVVVGSVPLLSKNSQGKQSVQFTYCSHLGGSSYFSITSWITFRILWVPMPTRQPLSETVSYTHL